MRATGRRSCWRNELEDREELVMLNAASIHLSISFGLFRCKYVSRWICVTNQLKQQVPAESLPLAVSANRDLEKERHIGSEEPSLLKLNQRRET